MMQTTFEKKVFVFCTADSQVTVGKVYGAMLMFEHWRAYKNRKSDHGTRLNPRNTLIQRVTVEEAANSQNAYNVSLAGSSLNQGLPSRNLLSSQSLASVVSAASNVSS